jgi:hypothetical protein
MLLSRPSFRVGLGASGGSHGQRQRFSTGQYLSTQGGIGPGFCRHGLAQDYNANPDSSPQQGYAVSHALSRQVQADSRRLKRRIDPRFPQELIDIAALPLWVYINMKEKIGQQRAFEVMRIAHPS